MRIRTLGAGLAAGILLAVPATAGAHVTVHPNAVPADGYTVLNLVVPNEEADANTTKVEVQLPPGFASVSTEPVAGWKVATTESKLATPVKTDDGEITTQVDTITWTADGKGLPPGGFQRFPISVHIPNTPGKPLTFKALQTYSSGEVVRWIGAPGSDKPASQIAITDSDEAVEDYPGGAPGLADHHGGTSTTAADDDDHDEAAAASTSSDHDDDGDGLAIAALIVGALGLIAGGAAFALARRRPAA
jgi:periplasmic copper chaperone A